MSTSFPTSSLTVVGDASAFLQDICHTVRSGSMGIICQLVWAGRVVTTASVVTDVDEKIDRVARSDAEALQMRAVWSTRYMPLLRTVEPTKAEDPRLDALAARDPDDIELATVAINSERPVLLTEDDDLIDLRIAAGTWLGQARLARDVVQYEATLNSAVFGGQVIVLAIGSALKAARRGSPPAGLVVLAAGVGMLWALSSADRRAAAGGAVRSGAEAVARAQSAHLSATRVLEAHWSLKLPS